MKIKRLNAVVGSKKVVLIEVEEKQCPSEIIRFYQEQRIIFPTENAIADPGQYSFSRKKARIYQPVLLDGKITRVLSLRKEYERFRWKEIIIPEKVLETLSFTNCFLLGLS